MIKQPLLSNKEIYDQLKQLSDRIDIIENSKRKPLQENCENIDDTITRQIPILHKAGYKEARENYKNSAFEEYENDG